MFFTTLPSSVARQADATSTVQIGETAFGRAFCANLLEPLH